jgi:hypothetical protein
MVCAERIHVPSRFEEILIGRNGGLQKLVQSGGFSQALFQLSEARKLAIVVDRFANPQVVSVARTGLQVTAYLGRRLYPCGLKSTPDQMASLRFAAPRNSARVELHYLATTVNLFLRDSLG